MSNVDPGPNPTIAVGAVRFGNALPLLVRLALSKEVL